MKTVKILIATAILSTSFYACKKEEMDIKSGKVSMQSESKNNMAAEAVMNTTSGMIRVVFDKMGNMVIEGNPGLEKLISMYNASTTAIKSAKEVFEITQQEKLSIVFNNDGYAVASDIPKVMVGSSIDSFISGFCEVRPNSPMTISISKNNLTRNYEEFWNALPEGLNIKFLNEVKSLQEELPLNYTLQVSFADNQDPNVIYLDGNGNPQPIINNGTCKKTGYNWFVSSFCTLTNLWIL